MSTQGDPGALLILLGLLLWAACIIGWRQWRESMTIYARNLSLRPDERMASSNLRDLVLIGLAVALLVSVAAIWGVRL